MENILTRHTKNKEEYEKYFPKTDLKVYTIKRNAKLEDTIKFLPWEIRKTLYQTSKIAPTLVGKDPYDTCRNVFRWVMQRVEYRKDPPGKEFIQAPQATVALGRGDCDDGTSLITSILLNLRIFEVILTITMYDEDEGYQHIYPVAVLPDGRHVPMDFVAKKFDYEVPYLKKLETVMDLQFLNGIPESLPNKTNRQAKRYTSIDAEDLFGLDDLGELGKGKLKAKFQKAKQKIKSSKAGQKLKKVADKAKEKAKTVLHKVNRPNPATALLRTGILIGMKTNMFKIAEKLRYAYLNTQQAIAKGIDETKHPRLQSVLKKLENLFYGAGGKTENLKLAIMSGRGNRDKDVVAGLGHINYNEYSDNDSPSRILGNATYSDEINGVEGLGELGIATEAAVAAATGALTAIAALLKSIGDLKKKKTDKAASDNQTDSDGQDDGGGSSDGGDSSGSSSGGSDGSPSDDNSSGQKSGDNNSSTDNNSNQQNEQGQNTSEEGASTDTDPDTRAGAENESSNADTPAGASNQEGTDENQASSQDESTGNGNQDETSGADASGGEGKSVGFIDAGAKVKNALVKTGEWIMQNKVESALIGLVATTIIIGIVSATKKDKEPNKVRANAQVAGLPEGKKKHHRHHTQLRFQRLS